MNEENVEEEKRRLKPVLEDSYQQEPVDQDNPAEKSLFLYILIGVLILLLLIISIIFFVDKKRQINVSIDDLIITQPFVENNEFSTFTLQNGLKVIITKSNDGMENSFVSLSVGVGSQTDPIEFSGFTHLIEHLLFTGSKNFPEDNYIEKIVYKYNGENNGVTKSFTTSYYYKIGNGGMKEFAEVLADAVANPLFDEDRIAKEINNVNSEISMRMTFNKKLGYYKMLKKIGNPNARIFRDGFANIDVDQIDFGDLRNKIIAFHKKYYSANLMSLAIITDQPIGPIKELVEKHFNSIPNKTIERPMYEEDEGYEPPFLQESMGNVFYMQGFSEPSKFYMIFQVPSHKKELQFNSLEYFSFFLNYHSKDSLKDRLLRKNLVSGFEDELALRDSKLGLYLIEFDLTTYGETHISELIVEFYSYLDFLRKLDIKEDLFKEISGFSKYSFLFHISSEYNLFNPVQQDNFERVLDFSEKLLDHPSEMLFTSSSVWFNYNATRFHDLLNKIKPEKTVFMFESKHFENSVKAEIKKWEDNDINGINDAKVSVDQKTKSKTNRSLTLIEASLNGLKFIPENPKSQVSIRFNKKLRNTQIIAKKIRALSEILKKRNVKSNDEMINVIHSLKNKLLKTTFYDSFFNEAIANTKLQYELDFDNNRQFHYEKVPSQLWNQFSKQISESDKNFDRIEYFGFKKVSKYKMITNCKLPAELTPDSQEIKAESGKSSVEPTNEIKYSNQGFDMREINRILFEPATSEHAKTQKMLIIRALLIYKICLLDEFDGDDLELEPKQIFDSSRMKVYHKMYRKTLQPKFAVKIMLENNFLNESLIKGSSSQKQLFYIKTSLLCLYIKSYFTLKYHKEFVKANDFSIGTNGYAINFVFMGISSALPDFMQMILKNFEILKNPDLYDIDILENLRIKIVNTYSSYKTMTSLKLSTYFLDLMVDQLEIDYRTLEGQQKIKNWVYSITRQDLADFFKTLQSTNKLTILFTGNISEEEALGLSEDIKKQMLKDVSAQGSDNDNDSGNYKGSRETINKILDNILIRFKTGPVHYMIRQRELDDKDNNNVYLTYFRVTKSSVKINIINSMVSYWLRNYVFDKLRNKMNLGYVAHAASRDYYYRSGLIILVQGEKFRPANIEKHIEETVMEFIDIIKQKPKDEIEQIKNLIVEKYT